MNPLTDTRFGRATVIRSLRPDEIDFIIHMGWQPWFFTFGSGQAFPGCIICIWASDENNARFKMSQLFGDRWCTSYNYDQILDYDDKYGPVYLIGEYPA